MFRRSQSARPSQYFKRKPEIKPTSLDDCNYQMKTTTKVLNRRNKIKALAFATVASAALACTPVFAQEIETNATTGDVTFRLVRSKGLDAFPNAVPNAHGNVTIHSIGPVEIMTVNVAGLPRNTDFDFFVIQVPNAPFGLSWYQGDIKTDLTGRGSRKFIGRFSIETFIVAPGVAPAPFVFNNPPFQDATSNNAQPLPVQTYHLGLWFDSPADAVDAHAPDTVTPFNGQHNAGVQVLSTNQFPDLKGPLKKVH